MRNQRPESPISDGIDYSRSPVRVLFITNFCTHFLVRTFEEIARRGDVRFVFYSDGGETYWETSNQLHSGNFEHTYLKGFYLSPRVRVTPSLLSEALRPDIDVIVTGLSGRFALPASFLATRLRRKPFILWTGLWYHPQTPFHRLSMPLLKRIYRRADAILVYGEHVKRYLVEEHGCSPEKIFMFWQAVDVEKMGRTPDPEAISECRARWGSDPVILYVGRLDPVKSLDTLIRAYARLRASRPCQLVIVGKGPERDRLAALADDVGASVIFEPYIENARLPEVYAAASVFCLPSRSLPDVKEAWGLVLNEAMLQRCIPVASDAVGAAVGGLFFDEIRSLVFPERDEAALQSALSRALDLADDQRLRETIREHALGFDPATQARGLFDAVAYVAQKRAR